ncbi:hypothetical protein Goarm_017006 [Gossypium armourianum]|uniref:Uncharacterized protein n=1 Tax=Gossypium armourianum TaxID=34283 RepID=A0A7J9JFI8_9ROSI|nr:hypothetical protein [Gossypium armourianum]
MERIIKRVFFVIFTISFFFFSSFIEEQLLFVRKTSHPAYRPQFTINSVSLFTMVFLH